MPDIQKSVLGKRLGLDASNNLVIEGYSVFGANAASTKPPRIADGTISTAPSTAAELAPYGYHFLTSSPVGYSLADPVPGQRVTIITGAQTTATGRFVQTSTVNAVTFVSGSSLAFNKWSSTAAHTLELVGKTTTEYGIISNIVGTTISTSIGALSTI